MGFLGFQVNENSSYKVTCQLPNDKKAINYKMLYMEKTFNHCTQKLEVFQGIFHRKTQGNFVHVLKADNNLTQPLK